jgi:predicted RNA binding protein YcfA (HicA-like mRNA interferase family)
MIAPEITVGDHVDPTLAYPDEFAGGATAYFAHIGATNILASERGHASFLRTRSTAVKVSDILRMLAADGWYLSTTRGSLRQFKHPTKPGRVTVAGKPGDDLSPGTLGSILKQSGLKR